MTHPKDKVIKLAKYPIRMVLEGDIFKQDIDKQTEFLIEGNLWTLNCALFATLTGDLHHGSSQYLLEGVRIAFTKYAYHTELRIFNKPEYGEFLNRCLQEIGFVTRRGSYREGYIPIDKRFIKFLPNFNEKFSKEENLKDLEMTLYSINFDLWKLSILFFVIDFLTRSNDIMSRMEVDPIGTFMFELFKKMKPYLKNRIENYDSEYIDYGILLQEFLSLKENSEMKLRIEQYNRAKLVTYFDLDRLIGLGESRLVEFKESIDETNSFIKDCISFANSSEGGKIFVGVTDNGGIIGVKDVKSAASRIIDILRSNTKPPINPIVYPQEYKSKQILIIEIEPASEVIYHKDNKCFIRVGEKSLPPSKEELKRLFIQKREFNPENIQESPTIDMIREKILESGAEDWLFDSETSSYTYKKNTNLMLRRSGENGEFKEGWMNVFADSKGFKAIYEIIYLGSLIERKYFVSVDGGRCYIPYPKLPEMIINKYDYKIGEILNVPIIPKRNLSFGRYDDYLEKADIRIV